MTFQYFKESLDPKTHTWLQIHRDDVWAKTIFPTFQAGDEFWACDYNGGPLARSSEFYHVRNNEILGTEKGDLQS